MVKDKEIVSFPQHVSETNASFEYFYLTLPKDRDIKIFFSFIYFREDNRQVFKGSH